MSPIIRMLYNFSLEFYILHTGQHYSYNMDQIFFEQLKLPQPKYNLKVGSGTHAEETGKMLIGIENILLRDKPDIVLVEGDTNSVLAGSLAAVKVGIPVAHVEAGLRSFDRNMPEEINRVITDHISYMLFAPTEHAKKNLLSEGISEERIYVTGNTIVDAVYENLKIANKVCHKEILKALNIKEKNFFLATVHRQENVDNPRRFKEILDGLKLVQEYYSMPVVYTIHPRARSKMKEYNLDSKGIILTEPLDYLNFLMLESKAKMIFTDSGGVQEEACILGVPCVTLRDNTERPETLEVGANIIAGTNPRRILEAAERMMDNEGKWPNPFGDGKAGERIVKIIKERIYG